MIKGINILQVLGGPQQGKIGSQLIAKLINYQKPINLSGFSSTTWDISIGYNANLLMDTNKTLILRNLTPGDYGTLKIIQDSVGSRTLTLPTNSIVMGTQGGSTLVLSTNANTIDIATFYFDGVKLFWNLSKY